MLTVVVILFCFVLLALTVFQVALIAGAPLGRFAWGGQDAVLPRAKRIGSVVSIVLYAVIAFVAAERAQLVGLFPDAGVIAVVMWVITAYFALGIAMNAVSRSRPERLVMVPVAGVLAVLALLIALS